MENYKILCLNFGSTSTKIAAFNNEEKIFAKNWSAGEDEYPAKFKSLVEHEAFATDLIEKEIAKNSMKLADFDIFAARGGAQVFIKSGAYLINKIMYDDTAKFGGDRHPGKLATRICYNYSLKYGKPAYIVNGPSVDEFQDIARMTGLKEIFRESRIHALNQKEVGHRYAKKVGRKYDELNLLVCHIGGGISVTAHKKGLMLDSTDIIQGEGPMSPTRAGAMPAVPLIELAFSGKYGKEELIARMVKIGGFIDHLGTEDLREVERRVANGDKYAKIVLDSMLYQIAKHAGSMAVVLEGNVDQIILTGGMTRSKYLVDYLTNTLAWIAGTTVYPGEFEMEALAAGALRVANHEEKAHVYDGVDVWAGFAK